MDMSMRRKILENKRNILLSILYLSVFIALMVAGTNLQFLTKKSERLENSNTALIQDLKVVLDEYCRAMGYEMTFVSISDFGGDFHVVCEKGDLLISFMRSGENKKVILYDSEGMIASYNSTVKFMSDFSEESMEDLHV
jgi:hypothetical protein